MNEAQLLDAALRAASDTRFLHVEGGARHQAPAVFETAFGAARAVVVADGNTFAAAGRDVHDAFRRAGHAADEPFVFGPHVYADYPCVEELMAALRPLDAIPVAVGSGTLNDLTKLSSHRLGRPYMVVATAASMDGYTAFGASITCQGSKQTFECPAPRAVAADLDVIAAAPDGMNASGYADLMAKCAAGADWILAEAAGVEPIHAPSWNTVHGMLRTWLASPSGIARREPEALRLLTHGLLMGGFAMQAYRSSRPASGADHQFSHLWDMQHHTHHGTAPSHGFKVGIGTLASMALYEELLTRDIASLDTEVCLRRWPSLATLEARIAELFGTGELAGVATKEIRAKYIERGRLRAEIDRLRHGWPELRARLRTHLYSREQARDMLAAAGCPVEPEQIGISRERLRRSYEQAYFIRRRYTVLDFAARLGLAESALDHIFSPQGAHS
jgi:glycerol-1-phosphate dehydrogenase [NAD(P)+]